MKKASIAVALVLVFGLFATAFSLTPAIAQYGTSPSPSSTGNSTSTGSTAATGNTTTSSNATTSSNTTSTNATSTQGSTFSARGSIASMIFDTGTTVTNNTNETGTSSTNATSMGNTTTSSTGNMTSSGNTTLSGNATGNTTMSQTIVGGDNSTGNATGMIGTNTTTSSMGNTTTSSTGNMTSSSGNATSTASQLDQPYVLSGDWNLDVKDGTVSDFKATWTMVHIDGTGRHTHEVSNFQSSNGSMVQLQQNGTTVIFGTADVMTNGSPKWTGVDAVITIDNNNIASVSFASEKTDDHFHGQPIYGVVDSLTENGKEMIQSPGGTMTSGNATGGNMTGNTTQGAQNPLNQTGNALKNATEGIKDFFNGTG